MDPKQINQVIEKAVKDAREQGVSGKDITPFLLREIKTQTEGRSLEANLQLVYNNALVGAQIARALEELGQPE